MVECAGIRDGWNGMLGDACPYGERALAFSDPAGVLPALMCLERSLTEAVCAEEQPVPAAIPGAEA